NSPGCSVRYGWPLGIDGCSKLPLTRRFTAGDELGCTCSVADTELPGPVAVSTTGVTAATAKVVIGKVIPLVPSGTVTFAGTTAAAGSLLLRDTITPPGPAN